MADGVLTVQATVTDASGNTATAGDSFTLDTSADLDTAFTVSVAADDLVTNAAESTDVSLSLSGIDSDAASVSVEITDGTNKVTADADYDELTGWTVTDQSLSSLDDGTLDGQCDGHRRGGQHRRRGLCIARARYLCGSGHCLYSFCGGR